MSAALAAFPPRNRRESKALVVTVSMLQLAMVVLVWLLAIVPAALLALGAMVVRALRPARQRVPATVDSRGGEPIL